MKLNLLLLFLAVSLLCPLTRVDEVSKELKSKLEARHVVQIVTVVTLLVERRE